MFSGIGPCKTREPWAGANTDSRGINLTECRMVVYMMSYAKYLILPVNKILNGFPILGKMKPGAGRKLAPGREFE